MAWTRKFPFLSLRICSFQAWLLPSHISVANKTKSHMGITHNPLDWKVCWSHSVFLSSICRHEECQDWPALCWDTFVWKNNIAFGFKGAKCAASAQMNFRHPNMQLALINPPTRVGVHSTLYYVASKIWFKIQNPKSEIQNPKSEIQNPKSKIRNPKSEIQNLHKKKCYITLQNPKSEIQNPKSEIQNPKSKIPRQNPKFGALGASHKELLHNDPKSKIQNPQNPAEKVWILDFGLGNFGFWIPDFGFWIPDFGFWGGPGDVPLGNSVTVPGGQRLESPLVRQLYLIGLGEERKRGKGGREGGSWKQHCGARTIRMGNICQ